MKKVLLTMVACTIGLLATAADYTHGVGIEAGGMNGISWKGFIFGVEGLALQTDLGVRISTMGVPGDTHVRYPQHHELDFSIKKDYTLVYYTFELNPNIVYQRSFAQLDWGTLDWLAGGGVSVGLMDGSTSWDMMGYNMKYVTITDGNGNVTDYKESKVRHNNLAFKFGVNGIGGIEAAFKKAPLTLGVEFRMGYGLFSLSSDASEWEDADGNLQKYPSIDSFSFFDWALGAALRYRF
ncbi:MAG: hypothetical protein MJZ48_03080 [Paludibacteraceae bacterium]|nr:hypothetical protein [Paludibacteraceae bacterium]